VRLAKTKGEPSEWVIYMVSSDGNVFISTSWLPANPVADSYAADSGIVSSGGSIAVFIFPQRMLLFRPWSSAIV
jgi:hypothetical protein